MAASETRVCIRGETGTGKELIARTLHDKSARRNGPFVSLNCAAIPAELMESELFGHEKGSFTGAAARHIGKFEQAHGGTLFLDEIGDMPIAMQAKLLRVLEEGEIERVGGDKPFTVDVRVVVATHRNLEEQVRQGTFREDLYHRVFVFPIVLPPLRERREDIRVLAEHFARQLAEQNNWKQKSFRAKPSKRWRIRLAGKCARAAQRGGARVVFDARGQRWMRRRYCAPCRRLSAGARRVTGEIGLHGVGVAGTARGRFRARDAARGTEAESSPYDQYGESAWA